MLIADVRKIHSHFLSETRYLTIQVDETEFSRRTVHVLFRGLLFYTPCMLGWSLLSSCLEDTCQVPEWVRLGSHVRVTGKKLFVQEFDRSISRSSRVHYPIEMQAFEVALPAFEQIKVRCQRYVCRIIAMTRCHRPCLARGMAGQKSLPWLSLVSQPVCGTLT